MTEMAATQTKPFPRDAANLGFWGIILVLAGTIISYIPIISLLGGLASLAGGIMSLIAYFKLAEAWKDEKVKHYTIWLIVSIGIMVVLAIIGSIIISIGMAAGAASVIDTTNPQQMDPTVFISLLLGAGIMGIIGFLIILAGLILVGFFYYKLYERIGEVSGISEFKTAGLLTLIGVLTVVLLGLGILISFVGTVFAVIAWAKARQVTVDYKVED
ncbi:MAG: DUF996 domain-containing protein [Chlorobi bacterium]|nr:DUF996 domain-containing protein [Chlorobiota bacterium]